jgi:integrase
MSRIKSKKHVGVYQHLLANGDVSYYYNYKDIDGKKVWVCVGKKSDGYSERDAASQRRKVLADISYVDEPLYIQKRKQQEIIKVRELAQKYFDEKKDMKNYRDAYLKYLNQIDPFFGDKNIYKVKVEDVRDFKKYLIEKKKYKPASVNYYLALLRAIINYAISEDVITLEKNPSVEVKLLKLNNERQRILSEDEIEFLLAALIHNPKAYLFTLIGICTGARPQAIINLKRKDIDAGSDKISFMPMKQGPQYTVSIHEKLQVTLYDWVRSLNPEDYIFFRENPKMDKTKHISYIAMKAKIKPIMDSLFNQGLEANDRINKVSLYTLRHSFGSLLSAKGANAFVIKKLMNHSSIKTTDRYIKVPHVEAKKYIDAIL